MESGVNKLLTIAIPTYNRALILNTALEKLLPQCVDFKNEIQIIISDNASDDNTQEIINLAKSNYPELHILDNRNTENLGFEGNFKKCLDLANGQYIWLLSDDDHIEPLAIAYILNILRYNEIGVLFLEFDGKFKNKKQLKHTCYNNKQFIKKANYRLSLISAAIFNKKGVDNNQLNEFKSNALLGFVPVLNALSIFDNNVIVVGKTLSGFKASVVRFNALKIFVLDLKPILDYFKKITGNRLGNSFICTNILNHYILWKYQNKYKDDKLNDMIIYQLYSSYWAYWLVLFPLVLTPRFLPLIFVKGIRRVMHTLFIKKYINP